MLENYTPQNVLTFFEQMSRIPHGSGNTKAISDYLAGFAKDRGLEYIQDDLNNIVIFKDATPGYESAKRVILQGHMDMVCEKEEWSDFDFEKDSLRLKVDGDYLFAEGTTLGGDDGIGVALSLAILDDDDLIHGPLMAIFTVDEEVGMEGAIGLDKSVLAGGGYLLNLDSEKEGEFLTSCAGGGRVSGRLYLPRVKREGKVYEISIGGLAGGHSGEKIHLGSANAIMLLMDLLSEMRENFAYDLISADGGNKDNAIPRSAKARIVCGAPIDTLDSFIDDYRQKMISTYAATDPDLSIELEPLGRRFASVIAEKNDVLTYFIKIPDGVQEMSPDMPDYVLTSLNAGVLKTTEDELIVKHLIRSGDDHKRDTLITMVADRMESCDFEAEISGTYPAWKYREGSYLCEVIKDVTAELSMPCKFKGIHAGLETGLFYQANTSLDIVSFCADVLDIHTPKERLSLSSTDRCYKLLCALIERLAI